MVMKPVAVIEVSLEEKRVGRIALDPCRRALFEYDPVWIREGFSISPFWLPLQSGVFTARAEPFNGLFGVFNDSLPDGWGTLLTDRWLIRQGVRLADLTVLDRLSLVGDRGMGALCYAPFSPSGKENPPFSLDFYSAEVEKVLRADYSGALEELVRRAGSSGGARPKVLLKRDDGEWLVKFRASADPPDVGPIEYHFSLLAKKCGINLPETRLFEGKYFGVRRFDREQGQRFHLLSAAGLLHASYRLPSLDYVSLMKATFLLTRDIREAGKMFRLMVFNLLIGNKDDHAKNFSFIYRDAHWQLSPAFDLLPSEGFNGNHTTTVNGKGRPALQDCLDVARLSSFPLNTARMIIDEVNSVVQNG